MPRPKRVFHKRVFIIYAVFGEMQPARKEICVFFSNSVRRSDGSSVISGSFRMTEMRVAVRGE